jgi:hypothetical protein
MGSNRRAQGEHAVAGTLASATLRGAAYAVTACALWLAPATCLLVTPAAAGDATHFLICRSEGCIDIPSLRFFPKGQQPTTTAAPPPAASPSPPAANQPAPDPLQAEIETDIIEFCQHHPDERFCGKLRVWFERHPEARKPM